MVMRACVAVGTLLSFRLNVRSPSELKLCCGLLENRDPCWEETWRGQPSDSSFGALKWTHHNYLQYFIDFLFTLSKLGIYVRNKTTICFTSSSELFRLLVSSLSMWILELVCCRKSEILWTRKSRSFRLANRNVIRFLVLMESGLGSTLELSAFSTMVTWRNDGEQI